LGAVGLNQIASPYTGAATNQNSVEIRQNLRVLDRRNWWHWCNTVLVILLLMAGIASLSLPKILADKDFSSQQQIEIAVRGLLAVVLIFSVYMLYQQHVLGRLRSHLSSQSEVAAEQRARAEAFYELSILDPLTGLYNRRFSEDRLRNEIARAQKWSYPLILLLLDLDNFKSVNDRYGHSAGDLVLQEFGRRLSHATRGSDIAVRWGGDEFLVILPECPAEKIEIILSRLKDIEVEIDHRKIPITGSRGWAQYESNETAEDLYRRADEALYANKAMRSTQAAQNLVQA
jgi:two-component system cell cycle response regulator